MKVSAIDKAVAQLMAERIPHEQQLQAINLAISALLQQKDSRPKPPAKPRKAKKAAVVEPTS